MAGKNDSAGTSLLSLFDEVHLIEAFTFVALFQLLSKVVVANRTSVYDRFRRQNILIENFQIK